METEHLCTLPWMRDYNLACLFFHRTHKNKRLILFYFSYFFHHLAQAEEEFFSFLISTYRIEVVRYDIAASVEQLCDLFAVFLFRDDERGMLR